MAWPSTSWIPGEVTPIEGSHKRIVENVVEVNQEEIFELDKGPYSPWLFDVPVSLTPQMIIALLLDYSTMILPESRNVCQVYWDRFRCLLYFYCFISEETKDSPKKKTLKTWIEIYNKMRDNSNTSVSHCDNLHGFIMKKFETSVVAFNHNRSNAYGTPIGLKGLPEKAGWWHTSPPFNMMVYLNLRKIVPACEWDDQYHNRKDHICEPIAEAIAKLGLRPSPKAKAHKK